MIPASFAAVVLIRWNLTIDGWPATCARIVLFTSHFFILIAEIPDFFDADECELVIALAENKNLKDNLKRTDSRGIQYEDPLNTFRQWDLNNDEYIDPEEVSQTARSVNSFLFSNYFDISNALKFLENNRCFCLV